MPTQERLRELFTYSDGKLIRNKPCRNGQFRLGVGTAIGWKNGEGYFETKIDRKCFKLHRLIWVYHNGAIPNGMMIDHIDQNPGNNQIQNLRLVNANHNAMNRKLPSNNNSGRVGVYQKSNGRWVAFIKIRQRAKQIGTFDTKGEAIRARKEAEIRYGFHKNHGRAGTIA